LETYEHGSRSEVGWDSTESDQWAEGVDWRYARRECVGGTDQGIDAGETLVDLAIHLCGRNGSDLVCLKKTGDVEGADGRFTTTVHGAYAVIGMTGFCWGLAQCAYLPACSRSIADCQGLLIPL